MAKKIKNTILPIDATLNRSNVNSFLYKEYDFVVDFSFEGAYVSCKNGDFSNYLKDEKDFISKHRSLMSDVQKLSGHKMSELLSGSYRHCHKVSESDVRRAKEIIKTVLSQLNKDISYFEQLIECEDIYQIGFESEIRLFGTIQGNTFRVYFIDYYHDFNYDQRRNTRNKKLCTFCPTKSDIA